VIRRLLVALGLRQPPRAVARCARCQCALAADLFAGGQRRVQARAITRERVECHGFFDFGSEGHPMMGCIQLEVVTG
jgi:hypothetical protein